MKKLVALILTVILAVGAIFMVGCGNGNNGGDQTANSGNGGSSSTGSDQIQQVTTYPGVRSVRLSMGAMSETASTTTSTGEQTEAYSERVIVATILPTSALQQVDFTMTWQSDGTSEGIDEYLTLTQETDGSPKAVVRCTKDFSAKGAILITATARAGGLSDTLTATFKGVTRDFDLIPLDHVDANDNVVPCCVKSYSESRGDYFVSSSGFLIFEIQAVDFYGDRPNSSLGTFLPDVEFSGSDTYVYVKPMLEGLTEHETILRIKVKEFAETVFFDVDCGVNKDLGRIYCLQFDYLLGFFDAIDYSSFGYYVTAAGGGAFKTEQVPLQGIGNSLNANQYYTVIDYDLAVANSSIEDAVIDTYLGSEVMAMSEEALNEAYYEIILTDSVSKLTKTFRLWGRLPATSVDTGSDIIF